MAIRRIVACATTLFLFTSCINAQPSLKSLSLSVGGLRSISQDIVDSETLPFVEAEAVLGELNVEGSGFTLSGSTHVGYWRESPAPPGRCADCIRYSYRTATFGGRSILTLKYFPVPAAVLLGYSHHKVFARYESGTPYTGNSGQNHSYGFNFLEMGVRVLVPVVDNVQVGLEGIKYLNLGKPDSRAGGAWRMGVKTVYLLN